MKKCRFISVISVFCLLTAQAQVNDIANEIANYQPSKSDIISKGRNLVLDEFIADNIAKVEDTFLYLVNEVEDDDYRAFFLQEKIILACWVRHYDIALKEITRFDSIMHLPQQERPVCLYPANGILWSKMFERAHLYLESLYMNIQKAPLGDDEKAVLAITAKDLLENDRSTPPEMRQQETINQESTAFLKSYPDSPYARFVREYLRFQTKPKNWGFGLGLNLGYSATTGALHSFIPGYGCIGYDMDISFQRIILGIACNIGIGVRNRRDAMLGNGQALWPAETNASAMNVAVTLGFKAIDARHWALTPFAGYGGIVNDPAEKVKKGHPDLEGLYLNNDNCLALGLNLDYKLSTGKNNANPYTYYPVRLRVMYYKNFMQQNLYCGDLFSISLGIGLYARGIQRDL